MSFEDFLASRYPGCSLDEALDLFENDSLEKVRVLVQKMEVIEIHIPENIPEDLKHDYVCCAVKDKGAKFVAYEINSNRSSQGDNPGGIRQEADDDAGVHRPEDDLRTLDPDPEHRSLAAREEQEGGSDSTSLPF